MFSFMDVDPHSFSVSEAWIHPERSVLSSHRWDAGPQKGGPAKRSSAALGFQPTGPGRGHGTTGFAMNNGGSEGEDVDS